MSVWCPARCTRTRCNRWSPAHGALMAMSSAARRHRLFMDSPAVQESDVGANLGRLSAAPPPHVKPSWTEQQLLDAQWATG